MGEPIVFISHFRVKQGKLQPFKDLARTVTQQLQAERPRTLAYLFYLSPDGSEATIVHVFPDAEAMDLHAEGSEQRSRVVFEFLVPDGWEIYGTPSDAALEQMRKAASASGVTLTVQPDYFDGFLRGPG
jgi:quinol monooxygenase YgiN